MEKFLNDLALSRNKIRDPIYGFIPLTDHERRVIDTPLFQRLRRINQLALTKYVYPSAEHSRFVHSIGVMQCATMILRGVFSHGDTRLRWLKPSEHGLKVLRYAALLHDIGHLPFSHAVEKQWLDGLEHEDVSIHIIKNYEPIAQTLADDDVDCNDVASLLAKKPLGKDLLFHEIISGQLDADRADYLLRDSHACGVRYGEYDFPRFLQIFSAQEDREHGTLALCVDEKDLHMAESLLIARYHYNLQIPYHRTRSGYDVVLKKFASESVDLNGVFVINGAQIEGIDFDQLELLDDGSIFEVIKKQYRKGNIWASYLMRQKHLCPLIDTNNIFEGSALLFKDGVTKLRTQTGLKENEDFFVQEQEVKMLKRALPSQENQADKGEGNREELPDGTIRLMVKIQGGAKKPVDICSRSWIFNRLNETPHKIFRVYVIEEKKEDCKKIISQ